MTGLKDIQIAGKALFGSFSIRVFQKRLTFESVDWVGEICSHPERAGLERTKRWGKGDSSFSLWRWGSLFHLPLDTKTPGSPALGLRDLHQCSLAPYFSSQAFLTLAWQLYYQLPWFWGLETDWVVLPVSLVPLLAESNHGISQILSHKATHCLLMGMCCVRCIVKQLRHCANITECTYTKSGGTGYLIRRLWYSLYASTVPPLYFQSAGNWSHYLARDCRTFEGGVFKNSRKMCIMKKTINGLQYFA